MKMRRWTVGVDFGGTNVKVGLVSRTGRVARARVLPSKKLSEPSAFVEGVSATVTSLARAVGIAPSQLRGVCVGAAGPVDAERGLVHFLVNVPGWREVPLAERLQRRLRCRCLVENDVNLFALGEWRFGAGQRARQLVCLTLGTGVGGGLLFDGELYRGASGAAGELGHMAIDPRGRRCGCGARGCLEAQVGTAAILSLGRRAIRRGAGPLRTLARQANGRLTPALIAQAARQGDPAAREIWMEVGRSLGVGLANVINLLNPDRVVIGGGVSKAWGLFSPTLIETVRAQAMGISAGAARIVRARLGDRAGIVGAAVLVWQETGSGQ
ncbi:MAG: ROK family protein [Candidatus Omnitrophica bacterium]|nr:ROK family protein [Candidatus Omnitrophota bacterium]